VKPVKEKEIRKSIKKERKKKDKMISQFRLAVNVVFFLLDDSLASEFSVPTFRNTLPVPSS